MRAMKDSGIECVGDIPVDWSMRRLRFLCFITTGNQDTQDNDPDGEYPFYVRSPIVERSHKYTFDGPAILMSGDGAGAGRIFHKVSGKYACHQRVYSMQNIHDIDSAFLFYYLRELFPVTLEMANAKSTVDSVRLPMLQDFTVLLPSPAEQQRIAAYLDDQCGEIDKVLTKTRESIEEYKKLKQSVITEAVTKGIRPDRPMKPSGIEWIGDIPAEWGMRRLRHLGCCQNGISKGAEFFDSGYPFVSYSDVYKNMELPHKVNGLVESTDEERERYSVLRGDIFFTRTSETIEEIGFTAVCLKTIPNATFAGFLIRVRPTTPLITPEFSKYYFRNDSHRCFFVKEMNLVTRASLGQELLKSLPVLLPPLDEQQEIATYLDRQCAEIDRLIAKKEQIITELEGYKKSLIYECVTGKREVAG